MTDISYLANNSIKFTYNLYRAGRYLSIFTVSTQNNNYLHMVTASYYVYSFKIAFKFSSSEACVKNSDMQVIHLY